MLNLLAIAGLGLAIFALFFPMLNAPPFSDHWHVLYTFAHLPSGFSGWKQAAAYDVFGHARLQPLGFSLLYAFYKLFHASFFWQNLAHLFLFFAAITAFYLLIVRITQSAILTLVFCLQAAFAYTHSHLVFWSFHIHLMAGIAAVAWAAVAMTEFLETNKKAWLYCADILIFCAMLCYELFLPMGIIIYGTALLLKTYRIEGKTILNHGLSVYFAAGIPLLWAFMHSSTHGVSNLLSISHLWGSLKIAVTQIAWVNLVGQFIPWLGWPPRLTLDQSVITLNPSGWRLQSIYALEQVWIVVLAGLISLLYLCWKKLWSENQKERAALWMALGFALASYAFILALGRSATNPVFYNYLQFRYQLFPNMIILAMVVLMLEVWIKKRPMKAYLASALLCVPVLINVVCSWRTVSFASHITQGHGRIITSIQQGIQAKGITKDKKIYLDDDLVKRSGPWNKTIQDLAPFPGGMQWIFKNSERYFAPKPAQAAWLLDENLSLIPNTPKKSKPKRK